MSSCKHLANKLIDAAQRGEDILAILRSEREHLARCVECRDSVSRLGFLVTGGDASVLSRIMRQEELGQLGEPPAYPRFDLSFLSAASMPSLWRTDPSISPTGARRVIRQLAAGLELRFRVFQRKVEAAYRDLDGLLSAGPAIAPALATARSRGKTGESQTLSMLDSEQGLEITLAVRAAGGGKSHLDVVLREMEAERPAIRAEVSLRSAKGRELTRTREGRASFIALDPDQYTIEVRPTEPSRADHAWHFAITLEGR